MAKFRRKKGKGAQKINTASLPDIVFMLLFFFMVTTTMRETEVQVKVRPNTATEVKKLEQKSLVSYIYIGRPATHLQATYGSEPMIQMNDKLVNEEGIPTASVQDFVLSERENLPEIDKNKMVMSLRIDPDIPMGKVDDLKQALRRAKALIINYSARRSYEEKGR
ncbi:MAG: biopolymer transporter ExbD [Bacteroidales bacterium]|jgi:biopolymer transport protein ExbD|nr:biopolymer transporter ExbD [Bacteroidales bacterium]